MTRTDKARATIAARVRADEDRIEAILRERYPLPVRVATLTKLGYDRRLASDRLCALVARGVAERLTPRRVLGQWRWVPPCA